MAANRAKQARSRVNPPNGSQPLLGESTHQMRDRNGPQIFVEVDNENVELVETTNKQRPCVMLQLRTMTFLGVRTLLLRVSGGY